MSDPAFVNRVTGERVNASPETVVNGLLAVVSDDAGEQTCIVTRPDGHWSVELPSGRIEGDVPTEVLPSAITVESLASIAMSAGLPNSALVASDISPLVPAARRDIQPKDEDFAVSEALPYLEAAAARPYSRLKRLAIVAPVGRARRLDSRAPAWLAAHSEDWGRVTPSGVQPSRVLASEVHDEPDIYENAVLVEALVTAYRYVRQRHQRTSEIKSFYDVLRGMLSTVEGSWRTTHGLYLLIGDAYQTFDEGLATELEEELAALMRRLGATLAVPLVRETSPLGRRPLHVTNLLTDDARYGSAYRLLLQFRGREDDPGEEDENVSTLAHDHATFCVLLVLRALASLDEKVSRSVPMPGVGSIVEVTEDWSLEWTELNTVCVRHVDGGQLLLVPLQHALDADQTALEKVAALDCSSAACLVGYLPSQADLGESAPWSIDSLSHEQTDPRSPGLVPLSPLDPRSELRITRALRKIELGSRFERYGRRREALPATVRIMERVSRAWIQVIDRTGFAVTKQPTATDLEDLREALAPSTVYSKSKTISDEWSSIERLIQDSTIDIEALRLCPVCEVTSVSFEARQDTTFWCRCDPCGSSWGLRLCDVRHRYPVVVPGGAKMPERFRAGWVAGALGSNGIAVPCPTGGDFSVFVCPECRVCPNTSLRGPTCARCKKQDAKESNAWEHQPADDNGSS
ncbi:hypothetical protein OAM92_00305 [Acidimicrobiales bacterium]|nr:hypothetical protein [Acidimicrobiales bacterium]